MSEFRGFDEVRGMQEALAVQSALEQLTSPELFPLLAGYPAQLSIRPRENHYDIQGHLNNVAAVRIFQDVRVWYMSSLVRPVVGGLVARGYVVGVRELVTSYVTEARPGEQLFGGCRILGRSRRSWCFDE